jgi:HSP20 family molecular chaperone IbpA
MLDEPLTRSPVSFASRTRDPFNNPFFEDAFTPRLSGPAVDVSEDDANYIVEAELPGVRKEDVDVSIGDGGKSITIEGTVLRRSQQPNPVNQTTSESQTDGEFLL